MSTSYSIYRFAKPTKYELAGIDFFQSTIPFIFMIQMESRLWDVMSELGVSKNKAYLVIRELNEELVAQGFMCVRGKVNSKYFEKKFYGFDYATDEANK